MIIREVDLFQGLNLSDEVLDQLVKVMESVSCPAGQALFRQGDPADHFYILEQGSLNLSVAGAGRPTHLVRRPGETVGWSSVAGRETYTATVECAEDSRLIRINKDKLDALLRSHPASGLLFYKRLAAVVGERLIQCHQVLVRLQKEKG